MAIMNIKFHESADSFSLMNFKLYIIVSLFIITYFPADICNAEPWFSCDNTVNFTEGSAFATSLSLVFDSLVQNTSQTRFNTSVSGQIYGLLQCRGDATLDQCYTCSQEATNGIRQNCGNAIGGRIWYDFCYLHYENYSFFGQLDTYNYYSYSPINVSDPDVFNKALQSLLTSLSTEVVNVASNKLYASGKTAVAYTKIYGLVQCTRDTSTDNCSKCISVATTRLGSRYYGTTAVRAMLGSCRLRYAITPFYNSLSPAEAPANPPVPHTGLSPPALEEPANSKHSNKISTILGVAVGSLLLALLVCLFTTRRRFKSAIFRREYEADQQVEEDALVIEDRQVEEDALVIEDRHIVTFKMETLVVATENFHNDNKLGEGGFGPVYKGTTHDGKEIAVKKLSLNSAQGKNEFMNEVKLVAKIQHRNLVKLFGCCAEGPERLLVYEYLPNNSLDKILFDPIKSKQLDWQKRYNIILGVARGLLYLHQDSQPRIIHRDIKASNILLDNKLMPKIADFGLAKLFPENESYINTRVAGTFGYMSPEYALQGQLTVKADVYSFGVLLLEIVAGRKNTDYKLSPEMQILLRWAWRSYEAGNIEQMIDPLSLIETCDEGQASRCIHVGLLCTQAEASLRPPMSTVTLMLSSDFPTLPIPTKPVFVSSVNQNMRLTSFGSGFSDSYATTSSTSSLTPLASSLSADATITDFGPR